MKKRLPWLWTGYIGDDYITQLNGDYFMNHDIRIPIKPKKTVYIMESTGDYNKLLHVIIRIPIETTGISWTVSGRFVFFMAHYGSSFM